METFSALLAICAGNSPVSGEFPTQRPVTRSFDVFFDLRLYKRSRKQSWGWWLETLSCPLWRHRNEFYICCKHKWSWLLSQNPHSWNETDSSSRGLLYRSLLGVLIIVNRRTQKPINFTDMIHKRIKKLDHHGSEKAPVKRQAITCTNDG